MMSEANYERSEYKDTDCKNLLIVVNDSEHERSELLILYMNS